MRPIWGRSIIEAETSTWGPAGAKQLGAERTEARLFFTFKVKRGITSYLVTVVCFMLSWVFWPWKSYEINNEKKPFYFVNCTTCDTIMFY